MYARADAHKIRAALTLLRGSPQVNDYTPLCVAAENGHVDMVQFLVNQYQVEFIVKYKPPEALKVIPPLRCRHVLRYLHFPACAPKLGI